MGWPEFVAGFLGDFDSAEIGDGQQPAFHLKWEGDYALFRLAGGGV